MSCWRRKVEGKTYFESRLIKRIINDLELGNYRGVGFEIFDSEEVSGKFFQLVLRRNWKTPQTYLAVSESVAFMSFSPLFSGAAVEEAPELDEPAALSTAGTCRSWEGLGIMIFDLGDC